LRERERDEEVGACLARRRSSERQHGADLQEAAMVASDLVVTVSSFGKERKRKLVPCSVVLDQTMFLYCPENFVSMPIDHAISVYPVVGRI
jgi:hypothetical protein